MSINTQCHQFRTWMKPLLGLTFPVIPQWHDLVSIPSPFVLKDISYCGAYTVFGCCGDDEQEQEIE